jgi:hypothetical protein
MTRCPGSYWSMSHAYICTQKDTQTHELSCAHKKHSELVRRNRFFGLEKVISISLVWERQWDGTFPHCERHNGWWFSCRIHVYAGGSDQTLYQHMTVLTPDITVSFSSVPPSFLSFVVILVLFRGFLMVRMLFEKNVQTFTSRDLSRLDVFFSMKTFHPVNFSTLTW